MNKEILIEQHEACFNDDAWFVSLKTVLDGLTAEQAEWKPSADAHSISELVSHLLYWNKRWLLRFKGELETPEVIDIRETFDSRDPDWESKLSDLFTVMEEWLKILNTIDSDKLASQVNPEHDSPWYSPIAHQNIHNAYHIGQILMIRKIQGNWDPAKGVY